VGEPGENIDALAWSPDGRRIAFVVSRFQIGWDDAEVSLYIRDLGTQDLSRVLSSSSPPFRSRLDSRWPLDLFAQRASPK